MDIFILILELIGTVAFSISGAVTAIRKNMDIFGVLILGLTTAVGGGIIRDLILGYTPPATFRDPLYAVTALITAGIDLLTIDGASGGRRGFHRKPLPARCP